jgi:hypothetical protein
VRFCKNKPFMKIDNLSILKVKWVEIMLLVFLIAIFLAIEMSFIKSPGVWCDEANIGVIALNIKRVILDSIIREGIFKNNIIYNLKEHHLFMGGYHGILDSYITAFIFYLLPAGVVSLRITVVLFGALTIALTYLFMKEFFNKRYAFLAILLLVVNPGFIMSMRMGAFYCALAVTIYMAILLFLLKWYRLKKHIYFCIAMFLMGLGMWTRIWFFWFIFGLSLTAAVFIKDIKQRFGIDNIKRSLKYFILGPACFSLGCFAIICYELTSGFLVTKYVFAHLKSPLLHSTHNNSHYFVNLSITMRNFYDVLSGLKFYLEYFGERQQRFINNFYPWAVFIGTIYLFIFVSVRRDYPYRKKILFLLVLLISMLAVTPMSHSNLPHYHFYFFFPLVQMILSIAIISSIRYFKKFKAVVIAVVVFSIFLISKELTGLRGYFYYLKNGKFPPECSTVIYDLTDYLVKEKMTNVIAGSHSWALRMDIELCSGGLIKPVEIDDQQKWPYHDIRNLISQNQNSYYVFYPQKAVPNLNNLENFLAVARQLNLEFVEKKVFYEKDGTPVYLVMALKGNNKD